MYNTVLGAKPLQLDGRTFYYSDYNVQGHKVYSPKQHWACCAGTLPQVAADYRINTYFREPDSSGPGSVFVNLYIPSTLRWLQQGARMSLTQQGQYPFDSLIRFEVKASAARDLALNFRIPAWAAGASLSVNGSRVTEAVVPGTFAKVQRRWSNGDRVELELPMTPRLEAIDPQHPETVAFMVGPIVFFAMGGDQPAITRRELLAAKRVDQRSWQVRASENPIKLLPFTDIGEEQYSTYLRIA